MLLKLNLLKLTKVKLNKMGPINRPFSKSSSSLISQTLKLVPSKLANKMRRRRSSSTSIRHRKNSSKSSTQSPSIASCSSKSSSNDKQNLYNQGLNNDSELNGKEEPAFLYQPVDSPLSKNKKRSSKLDQSIMLLNEGLVTGSLVDQFERMYCEKPDEDIIVAKLPVNLLKNRYRDISPYDSTRVKIKGGSDADYINASHVKMEIPNTGIKLNFIACQGPLQNTENDFWTMVYEQKSTLIVMVTPLIENDFIKCHKYWPDLNDTLKLHDDLKVTCIKQNESSIMMERKFSLTKGGKVKRTITHLLYKQWPDHGVPDDSTHFHQLINTVRRYRAEMNGEPIIVHCSAGIGRTGVLILMETALCLIENNLPVYPLELLKTMRDQRPRLIQTQSQFTFVLQAIYDIYKKENQNKPEIENR